MLIFFCFCFSFDTVPGSTLTSTWINISVFFLPGNQPVLGFAFSYLSWVEPVLGGCFSRRAPEGSNRGLLFVIPFLGKNQYKNSVIKRLWCLNNFVLAHMKVDFFVFVFRLTPFLGPP